MEENIKQKTENRSWRIDLDGHKGIDKKGIPYNEPAHVNWQNWAGGKSDPDTGYGHCYYDRAQ